MNTADVLLPMDLNSPDDPLLSATLELERCARLLDLEDWVLERLRHCEQEMIVNFLLAAESGRAHATTGMVARHCSVAGPAAIPFQVSRNACRNCVCADAMRTSWMCALFGIHFGGGAAALITDPQKPSESELKRAVGTFAQQGREMLCNAGVIFPKGVNAVEMDWLEAGLGERGAEIVSGRSSLQNAAEFREELVIGWMELVRCAAGNLKQRVAVQGFSDDVRALVKQLLRKGARIVAVADESGGVRHALGFDPELLDEHVRQHGVLLGYPEGDAVLNADVLESECDVLIVAGGERQISSLNAARVKAKVIVEVTPGAVTGAAGESLAASGKLVVPSMLCEGAAMLRAVAEIEEVGSSERRGAWIRRQIRGTWRSVVEAAGRWKVPVADAALALGVERVAAMVRAQGT